MPQELLDDFKAFHNPDGYKACYNCGETNYQRVRYTLWGGILGPKLLNHVKSNNCKTTYNGKTGQSNKQKIILYMIAFFVLGFILLVVIAALF